MKRKLVFLSLGILLGLLPYIFHYTFVVRATPEPKVYWCHCEPNGNCQTLHISTNALIQAGHEDANGNPLHAGDHAGACTEASPTPTVTPTNTNTPTPTPTKKPKKCDEDHEDCLTPTPSPSPTPTQPPECDGDCEIPSPTPTQPPEPTVTPEQHFSTPSGCSNNCGGTPPANLVCTVPIDAPILLGFKKTSDTSVFWSWWASKSDIDKQWILYGYEQGNYPYSVFIPKEATGFEVGALEPGHNNWARVCVSNNAGCVACSNDLDP